MKKIDVVNTLLAKKSYQPAKKHSAKMFAPSNIALCKYWGKRNAELNLPVTSSLSISLGDKGSVAEIRVSDADSDSIFLNNTEIGLSSAFGNRLITFLNLFRKNNLPHFEIVLESNIPIAAGLASSASGFASIVLALNDLYQWDLAPNQLSILARLGSGSASRSIWHGFVEWQAGANDDGMDSHGEMIEALWPELSVGLLILSEKEKGISSREAMQRTVTTSSLYSAWPSKVDQDLPLLKKAILDHDFDQLGKTAESNAMSMHATMLSAWPPIIYSLTETTNSMQKVWKLRKEGLPLYFTQDAGPNLKLLFLKKDLASVSQCFPAIEIVHPFLNHCTK